jgi:superfamily II DNA or RNA helicase
MGDFDSLIGRLDLDVRRRGKQFEHICKWFLTNDPVYQHELRRVWLWDEWPDRWGGDAGIDLVAEDRGGHLWAIQAKAYDPAYRVTKRDVNTFLAESGRAKFSYRMLIATTNLIDRIGERTIQDQEKRVTFFRLNDLQAADVDWPASPTALRPPKRGKPASPHDYQREAIKKVVKRFETSDRGQLIMACGTGKTLTALFIYEKLAADRTLVLVPSLSLLKQTLNTWRANGATEFASLPVCSDETVVRSDDDPAISHTSDVGVPVTTDPVEIAAFMRQRSGPRVVFATYQSSPQIAEAFTLGRVPAFDLVIADEAHRCAGSVSSDFATVLDPTKIKAKRLLFMTATPRYFTGRVLKAAGEADFEYASMDDADKFGTVFYRLGFSEAIQRGLLSDYQVAIVGVDDSTYRDWADRAALVTLDGVKVTDARTLAGQIGLAKAMRKYDLRRTISFHSRVKRARDFAQSVPEVIAWMPARQRPKGKLWSAYASGEMPAGDRYVLLQHLGHLDDGERGLLSNARCLAEGVDVPTLDGVAFIDPRRSEVDIVQAVGRAIRKSDEKDVGTIVIPVFIDTDSDAEVALRNSAFEQVWDVIKALRSHDDELGAELDELRRQMGRQSLKIRLPNKIQLDLPATVGSDFARAFDVRLVEHTTVPWEFWYGLLENFAHRNGHARVSASYEQDGYKLGAWVANQRGQYAKGVLKAERQQRLEEIAGWTWDPVADYWVDQWAAQWEEGFDQLLKYVGDRGDARVPSDYTTDDGYRLGWWVTWQRGLHGEGTLGADRERRLCDLPGWTWDVRADQWEEGFVQLNAYVKEHQDARVPKTCTVDGFNLGVWVAIQRRAFGNGSLNAQRQHRLEGLPAWSWDPFTDQWDDGYSRLLEYLQLHGDARVPRSYAVDGYQLGAWVKKQRGAFGKGAINLDRQHRLESLSGWTWDPFTEKWEEGFGRLVGYVDVNGNARVPKSCKVAGYHLGSWVGVQRVKYRRGALDADRQRRLEELPGWKWDTAADQWEDGFSRLQEYVEAHGDARVPRSYIVDGYRLGPWVNWQRLYYTKGTLDADRQRRLEKLPGWRWDPRGDQWELGYNRLVDYIKDNGDARVASSYSIGGYRLGTWVGVQRVARAKGNLRGDRERLLQELPGWTWNSRGDQWEEGYSRLLQYVNDNDNARVPKSYKVDGCDLGTWVATQRTKHKRGGLDAERRRRLEKVPGWSWDPFADQWEEGFRRLVDYVSQHGDARVPRSCVLDGFTLGGWVQKQRSVFNRGGGDAERRRRLENLPGWTWKPNTA